MKKLSPATGALLASLLSLVPAVAQQIPNVYREVHRGGTVRVIGFYNLDPNCRPLGMVTINVVTPPRGGTVSLQKGELFPKFDPSNIRYKCNLKKAPVRNIFYTASRDFTGDDSFTIETVGPEGEAARSLWTVHVD